MRKVLLLAAVALAATAALADDEVTHAVSAAIPKHSVRRVIVDIPAGEIIVHNGSADRITVSGDVRRNFDGSNERVALLSNPDSIIPKSLNLALASARGRWFVRVDAHASIPHSYVRTAVSHLVTGAAQERTGHVALLLVGRGAEVR